MINPNGMSVEETETALETQKDERKRPRAICSSELLAVLRLHHEWRKRMEHWDVENRYHDTKLAERTEKILSANVEVKNERECKL